MHKYAQLLQTINDFSSDAHWSYRLIKTAKDAQELLSESENFDIKDETLFEQFETFMDAYRELIGSLGMDPKNLTPDAAETAVQLIDTLKRRYDRIITNPYLNAGDDFVEDFDPGTFTQFLSNVADDAESKLKAIAGDDVDLSEMYAAQIAQEFNQNQKIDRNDPNVRWTGDKVQQGLNARKRWFEELQALRRLNINHPRYQAYIASRRRTYQDIISDPERKAAYRARSRERQAKIRKDPKYQEKRKVYEVERAKEIQNIKQSGSLAGLITRLQVGIAAQKRDVARAAKKEVEKREDTKAYDRAIADATARLENDRSPANQALLDETNRKAKAFAEYHLNSHPKVVKILEALPIFYGFRDNIKIVNDNGWLDDTSQISNEIKGAIQNLIEEGERLLNDYSKLYTQPTNVIRDIITLFKSYT